MSFPDFVPELFSRIASPTSSQKRLSDLGLAFPCRNSIQVNPDLNSGTNSGTKSGIRQKKTRNQSRLRANSGMYSGCLVPGELSPISITYNTCYPIFHECTLSSCRLSFYRQIWANCTLSAHWQIAHCIQKKDACMEQRMWSLVGFFVNLICWGLFCKTIQLHTLSIEWYSLLVWYLWCSY